MFFQPTCCNVVSNLTLFIAGLYYCKSQDSHKVLLQDKNLYNISLSVKTLEFFHTNIINAVLKETKIYR